MKFEQLHCCRVNFSVLALNFLINLEDLFGGIGPLREGGRPPPLLYETHIVSLELHVLSCSWLCSSYTYIF